jgi:hypothetical protein
VILRLPAAGSVLLALGLLFAIAGPAPTPGPGASGGTGAPHAPLGTTDTSVSNFTNAINRVVTLLGLSGSGLLAIVWARVALSWFSHDVTKKIQAKERARDALIGTILFTAAVSGLLYGLAHWVVTGT